MADEEYEKAVADLRGEFAKLKADIVREVFDRPFVGVDAFGADRNGAPFHLILSALLKTSEDQSLRLVTLETRLNEIAAKVGA